MTGTKKTPAKASSIDLETRLRKLENEIEKINQAINQNKTTKKVHKNPKAKRVFSNFLILLASLFFVLSISSFWLKSNITNTDTWVKKTSEVISNQNVRNLIATSITDEIFTGANVDNYIAEILPENAQPLAKPLSGTLKDLTQKEIDKILQSPRFLTFWEKLNRQAHSGIINSLENANDKSKVGDNLVYIEGDNLMLNIQPIYANIKDKISSSGFNFIDKIAPAQINKQIKITQIEQMPTVLLVFNLIEKAGWIMIIAMVITGVGGLALSLDRRKSLQIFGISGITLFVFHVQSVYLSKYPFISGFGSLLKDTDSTTAQNIFDIYTKDLIYMDRLAILLLALIILFTFLTGPSKPSVWIRDQLSKLFKNKSNSPLIIWIGKYANYIITGLLIFTFLLTIFPIIKSGWYLISLFTIVGIICVILASLRNKK